MSQRKSNGENSVTVATITKPLPALAIQLDGDTFELEGDDLIICQAVETSGASVGDKVIVLVAQDGQLYYVMDKVV